MKKHLLGSGRRPLFILAALGSFGVLYASLVMAHSHHRHQHTRWLAPPPAYADYRSDRWADVRSIARGEKIYNSHCTVCHGDDGQGTGPAAATLAHRPADLTNHFHGKPGETDAYLFWRVSEGGLVEPFRSSGSAMPAFKEILDEDERWDVLAYVHAFFHLGLAEWRPGGSGNGGEKSGHH